MKYPWQAKQWQQVWQAVQAQRLPHGLLFAGMARTGKLHFAQHLAQALLCKQVSTQGDPCDQCHSCRLALTSAHPNIYQVVPEKDGHAIKVDQIRELAEFIQQSSLQGVYRIALIAPAHSMNISAANALLKTLEEPSSGAIIILVTDQSGNLPATIRSRCQRILFPRPDQELALQWLNTQPGAKIQDNAQALRLYHGAPLAVLAAAQDETLPLRTELFEGLQQLAARKADVLTLAAKWQKTDPMQWLDLFAGFVADIMRLQLGASHAQLVNQDVIDVLNHCSSSITLTHNREALDLVLKLRAQLGAGINFNKQLLIENLLLRWTGK